LPGASEERGPELLYCKKKKTKKSIKIWVLLNPPKSLVCVALFFGVVFASEGQVELQMRLTE
jgi:hypothetical protein